jgi:hypothetical protein
MESRAGIAALRAALIAWLCVFAQACSGDRPQVGGETHWLRACDADDPCAGDLQCICGRCTRACASDDACGGGRPASCYDVASPLLLQRCDRLAPELGAGVCLPSCDASSPCGNAQSCVERACVPRDPHDPIGGAAGPDDGSSSDASTPGGEIVGMVEGDGTDISDYDDLIVPISWSDEFSLPVLSDTIAGDDAAQLVGTWTARECDRTPLISGGPERGFTGCPQLVISADAGGVISGVLQFLGDPQPPPFPPVTDPDVGYPPGLSLLEVQDLFIGATGVAYPLRDARFAAGELEFLWSPYDLHREWCAAQTAHAWSVDEHTFYYCAPEDPDAQAELDPIKLALCRDSIQGPWCTVESGSQVPCACLSPPGPSGQREYMPLNCFESACHCERDGCDANTRSRASHASYVVDGDVMTGAWASTSAELSFVGTTFVRRAP